MINRRYEEAVQKLDKLIKHDPQDNYFIMRSQAHIKLKNYELAREDAEKAITVCPKWHVAWKVHSEAL